jgi:hypothetical protein
MNEWLDASDNVATFGFSTFIVLGNVFGIIAALHSDWVTGTYVVQVGVFRTTLQCQLSCLKCRRLRAVVLPSGRTREPTDANSVALE